MSFGKRELDRTRPEIDFPGETPPDELVVEDIIEGTGKVVTPGSPISCHYVGVAWSTGAEFDASWNRGQPLELTAGIGQVITGWVQGLLGMKAGGLLRLEIPHYLSYGEKGAGAAYGPIYTYLSVVRYVVGTKIC